MVVCLTRAAAGTIIGGVVTNLREAMMRKALAIYLLASVAFSCSPDPTVSKAQFPAEIAQASCHYYFTCCVDSSQRQAKVAAATESECNGDLTSQYAASYAAADERTWDGKAAQECVDQIQMVSYKPVSGATSASYCKRGFDPAAAVLSCRMILPVLKAGDTGCTYNWQCTTQFCHSGTCANPIQAGYACAKGEPCASGLACVNGVCAGQKPDGSSCTVSDECISASCGGGKCVNSTRYTCDGQP